MAQAAIAALGATVTYLLADRWVGRPAALGASTIYALDPLLVVSAGLLYPETTGALLLLCAALLLHDATRRDSVVLAAVTGSLFALLALVRPAALVLVPVGAVWLGLAPTIPPRRRALQVTVLMLACLVVLTPWTWRNYRIYGRLIPVSLVGTSAGGLSRSEIERQGLAGALLDRAAREPLALVSRMAIEFCHFWEFKPSRLLTDDPELREALHRQDPRLSVEPTAPRRVRDIVSVVSFGAELLLAFIGLAVMWRSRRREAILLVALVLAYAFAHSLFVGRLRYRITVLPLLFIMAGAGSAALHAAVRRRRLRG
jgi:4-amino-4-deoxy-L-arabinose transferase-like glycosyltransferase